MNKSYPILPIGKVNLTTGKNELFGTIWDGWEPATENRVSTNILVLETEKMTYRVVHSSGDMKEWATKANVLEFKHDQTGARIGQMWKVIGVFPHTKLGLLDLQKETGKSSLSFATFK